MNQAAYKACVLLSGKEDKSIKSIQNRGGQPVTLESIPHRDFPKNYLKWAGNSEHRKRQLIILHLLGNGWKNSEIAELMLSSRGNITRSIQRARASLQEFHQNEGIASYE